MTSAPPDRCRATTARTPRLVAALAPDGLHVPWLIEGAMDTATFAWYITEQLAPTLRPGQVVVLDNLSVHKAASIRQAIEARHCQLLFLPPYSPDFTPIEQAFSKIKAILRGLGARTKEALWEAMRVAVEAITPAGCARLVRPRRLRPACSSYLKVALKLLSLYWRSAFSPSPSPSPSTACCAVARAIWKWRGKGSERGGAAGGDML